MQDVIQQWRESGLSAIKFCAGQDISHSKFLYWKKRFRKKQSPSDTGKFVKVIPDKAKEGTAKTIELLYPNGVRLQVNEEMSLSVIGGLIKIF